MKEMAVEETRLAVDVSRGAIEGRNLVRGVEMENIES
jgi:hypothetical protein